MNAPLRPKHFGSPWPRVCLGELAEHRLGKMLDKAKNTGVPRRYLRNPNVRWFDVDLSDLQEILVEEKDVHKYELRHGDVIICEGGEAGRAALWLNEAPGIIFQKAIHRVRVGPRLDARFLIHRLMYDYFNGGLEDYYTGATIKHLTGQDLARYEIPLPPLDEQRRIAAILDKADALRRKRKRALELLDTLTQSIFVEMFGDMEDRQGLRHPVEQFTKLVASQRIGLVRSASELSVDATIPYLRMDSITLDGQLVLGDIKRTNASEAERREYELKPGDFLFNTRNSRDLVGKVAVFDGPRGYIYNNNILRVRFTDRVRSDYVSAFFRTRFARFELELRKSGTTSVFAVYQKSLDTMPIAVPPIGDQERFTEACSSVRRERARLAGGALHMDHLFASLQHRAFSGQL